ncbi:MAG: hypothetical protein ACOYUB_02360 [Patescibacteria group bacterium]
MKTILVALAFFILGFAVFWGYDKYQGLAVENERLKMDSSQTPPPSVTTVLSPTAATNSEAVSEKMATGSLEGDIGYPSEQIPPLEVYAFNSSDTGDYHKVKTVQNQGSYSFDDLPVGSYYVVAYAGSNYSGGYTEAVPCGLSVSCTDHSLIKVEVKTNEVTKGVDLKDWYAPENTFPQKPV